MINTTNTNYDFLTAEVVESGSLNEQGALNIALSFFDIARNIIDDAGEKEVILFKQSLPLAETFCASLSDWTFLVNSNEYEEGDVENDEPVLVSEYKEQYGKFRGEVFEENGQQYVHVYTMYKNFKYAYKLPNDFLKMKYICGDVRIGFAIKGNLLYCNVENPIIDYVSTDISNIPVDFGYMIAYRCAMEMAQHLDPEGTALSRATTMFQTVFTSLKQRDDQNFRLQNPAQNQFIDIDTTYWGYKK